MAITLIKFDPHAGPIKPFDCKVDHLNDFLLEEDDNIPNARHHALELLAETYLFEDNTAGKTVAYFSLLNDKVDRDLSDKTVWNRLSREIPNAKRRRSYPAVKIGRLAVSKDYQGRSFGRISLNYIKQTLLDNRVSGCRFVTVDALMEAVGFYEKNGFQILATPGKSDETVLMFFDLMKMKC
ncbi:MAG: GNAT family N-acetyltransferase [Bacteroidales bacterium]|nr:GNAT family N-acetyltransferase [Bacteroidales bacterium]